MHFKILVGVKYFMRHSIWTLITMRIRTTPADVHIGGCIRHAKRHWIQTASGALS